MASPDGTGLDVSRLIAGFSGGVVHALIFKQIVPYEAVASILTGTLTANFLSPAAGHYLPEWMNENAVAFLVGLSAMAICQGLIGLVKRKLNGSVDSGAPRQ